MVFTVIIPTRNRPAFLIEAIKSVQSQTFKEWELIIVDDASDVDIKREIEPYLSERIKYVRNDKSLGPGGTRNTGIRLASPESIYLSLLDDDDIYFPDFLQKTYETLQNTGEDIGFCWTGIENFYPQTNQRSIFFWDPPFVSKEDAFQGFLEKRLIGTGYGITFKKAVFKKVGLFDESLRAVEDTDFFLRVLKSFFYVKIPNTLVRITRHSSSHVNSDSVDRAEALECIYKKHRESILQNKLAWYNFKAKISSMYYRLGNKKMARQILASTLHERFSLRLLILWLKLEIKRE